MEWRQFRTLESGLEFLQLIERLLQHRLGILLIQLHAWRTTPGHFDLRHNAVTARYSGIGGIQPIQQMVRQSGAGWRFLRQILNHRGRLIQTLWGNTQRLWVLEQTSSYDV